MSTHDCGSCSVHAELARMGVSLDRVDRVVALAGNPNTGKSTLFNTLTGLRQHTGNWPGKTVTRAEGAFEFNKVRYKLVDLPGTYSLLSASSDEEVARDFLLFVDGWAKDADPNTAFSQTVEPLPFHTMSAYPYPPSEHYPDDVLHRRYRDYYNTRPALRLLRPLTSTQSLK